MARVAPEGVKFPARGGIPHLHRLVNAGRGQPRPIRAERHAPDRAFVPSQGAEFPARGGIPHLHRLV